MSATNPAHLQARWRPGSAATAPKNSSTQRGTLIPELRALPPTGSRRISANPTPTAACCASRSTCRDFRDYAVPVERPGTGLRLPDRNPRDISARRHARQHDQLPRIRPRRDRLQQARRHLRSVARKPGSPATCPEDADGAELAPDGRVMEMLSEHTLEGWFEGYVLTGRHGFFSTYEAFVHVIDSMFNQHAKWLETVKKELGWRAPISSINLLITSLVWRQDHNGFTHQDPGFLDVVTNKSRRRRPHLPPARRQLPAQRRRSLPALRGLLSTSSSPTNSRTCSTSTWTPPSSTAPRASASGTGPAPTQGAEPDVVMACAGDIATLEALAATAILREQFPDLKIRFVNVVDLFRLQPDTEHPHGLSDRDFDSLFTLRQARHLQLPRLRRRSSTSSPTAATTTTTSTSAATRKRATSTRRSS